MQRILSILIVLFAGLYVLRYLLRSGRSFVRLCRSKGDCDSCSCGRNDNKAND